MSFISTGSLVSILSLLALLLPTKKTTATTTVCVTNAEELRQALGAASSRADDTQINLAPNLYETDVGAFLYYSEKGYSLVIDGGYTAGCATYSDIATSARLSGRGVTAVLNVHDVNGDVQINHLTIENGEANTEGTGLRVVSGGGVDLFNLIVRKNHSAANSGGLYVSAGGDASAITGSLLVDNSADILYGAGHITTTSNNFVFTNNTVANNSSGAGASAIGGIFFDGQTTLYAGNDIFWGNTCIGMESFTSKNYLSYDEYGTLGGSTPNSNCILTR